MVVGRRPFKRYSGLKSKCDIQCKCNVVVSGDVLL